MKNYLLSLSFLFTALVCNAQFQRTNNIIGDSIHLFSRSGTGAGVRVHGTFKSDQEIINAFNDSLHAPRNEGGMFYDYTKKALFIFDGTEFKAFTIAEPVNPLMFGPATWDSTYDWAPAFNAAISYAQQHGGKVLLSAGGKSFYIRDTVFMLHGADFEVSKADSVVAGADHFAMFEMEGMNTLNASLYTNGHNAIGVYYNGRFNFLSGKNMKIDVLITGKSSGNGEKGIVIYADGNYAYGVGGSTVSYMRDNKVNIHNVDTAIWENALRLGTCNNNKFYGALGSNMRDILITVDTAHGINAQKSSADFFTWEGPITSSVDTKTMIECRGVVTKGEYDGKGEDGARHLTLSQRWLVIFDANTSQNVVENFAGLRSDFIYNIGDCNEFHNNGGTLMGGFMTSSITSVGFHSSIPRVAGTQDNWNTGATQKFTVTTTATNPGATANLYKLFDNDATTTCPFTGCNGAMQSVTITYPTPVQTPYIFQVLQTKGVLKADHIKIVVHDVDSGYITVIDTEDPLAGTVGQQFNNVELLADGFGKIVSPDGTKTYDIGYIDQVIYSFGNFVTNQDTVSFAELGMGAPQVPADVFLFTCGKAANMHQPIDLGNFNINNLADPTTAQQAATKAYVDAHSGGGGGGTLTGVTGTAPISSSGGTTPVISISQATTSTNGYLTSTDWNTFNGKQNNLGFTPYNATNPNAYISLTALSATSPLFYNNATGVISSQAATTSQNGYLTSTDWNTFNGKLSSVNNSNWSGTALSLTNGGNGGISSATLGDIWYGSGTNTMAALPGNTSTSKKVLTQTGSGTFSSTPSWGTLSTSDITGLGSMATQSASAVTITGGTAIGITRFGMPQSNASPTNYDGWLDLTSKSFFAQLGGSTFSVQLTEIPGTPTVAVNTTNAGTGATASITKGDDNTFQVSITTGTGTLVASSVYATVTLGTAKSASLIPTWSAASSNVNTKNWGVDGTSSSTMDISVGTAAAATSTTYKFNIQLKQK